MTRTEVQASKQPKRGRPQRGKGTTNYRNLHQSFEAYQLKKGGGKSDTTPNLEEPSPAVTARLEMEVACTLSKATIALCRTYTPHANKMQIARSFHKNSKFLTHCSFSHFDHKLNPIICPKSLMGMWLWSSLVLVHSKIIWCVMSGWELIKNLQRDGSIISSWHMNKVWLVPWPLFTFSKFHRPPIWIPLKCSWQWKFTRAIGTYSTPYKTLAISCKFHNF